MTTIYDKPHFAAGKIVPIRRGSFTGNTFHLKDWLVRINTGLLDPVSRAIQQESPKAKSFVFGHIDGKTPASMHQDDLNLDLRFITEPARR